MDEVIKCDGIPSVCGAVQKYQFITFHDVILHSECTCITIHAH